jgi:redox-sensitive bicupin YhaK (pirin superfamily)
VAHRFQPVRHAWVHVAEGKVALDGQELSAGDGVAVSDESEIRLVGASPSQALLFDLS